MHRNRNIQAFHRSLDCRRRHAQRLTRRQIKREGRRDEGTLMIDRQRRQSRTETAECGQVPLAAFSSFGPGLSALSINHQGPFVATTFSFNLPPGESLGVATAAIKRTMEGLNVPISVHGDFAGTAQVFQQSLSSEPLLILTAIVAVYIVLGILYESYIHPITILSTLPS